eukprot:2107984-Amphidinium_carterae.1
MPSESFGGLFSKSQILANAALIHEDGLSRMVSVLTAICGQKCYKPNVLALVIVKTKWQVTPHFCCQVCQSLDSSPLSSSEKLQPSFKTRID